MVIFHCHCGTVPRFRKSIEIETIASPYWAPTLEFKIHLAMPENCALGDLGLRSWGRTCLLKSYTHKNARWIPKISKNDGPWKICRRLQIWPHFLVPMLNFRGHVVFFWNACCFCCFWSLPHLKMNICTFEVANWSFAAIKISNFIFRDTLSIIERTISAVDSTTTWFSFLYDSRFGIWPQFWSIHAKLPSHCYFLMGRRDRGRRVLEDPIESSPRFFHGFLWPSK